jgi:GT2 family glycosyltransferase
MTQPFLSILTTTHKRPQMLEICKASVREQTDPDFQHYVWEDKAGVGVAEQYGYYPRIGEHLTGKYILVLNDDDVLADPDLIAGLKRIIATLEQEPYIFIVKMRYGDRVLPDKGWPGRLIKTHVCVSNLIVRSDIWKASANRYRRAYTGDWYFAKCIWRKVRHRAYWHDKVAVATQQPEPGRGRSEDEIYADVADLC